MPTLLVANDPEQMQGLEMIRLPSKNVSIEYLGFRPSLKQQRMRYNAQTKPLAKTVSLGFMKAWPKKTGVVARIAGMSRA